MFGFKSVPVANQFESESAAQAMLLQHVTVSRPVSSQLAPSCSSLPAPEQPTSSCGLPSDDSESDGVNEHEAMPVVAAGLASMDLDTMSVVAAASVDSNTIEVDDSCEDWELEAEVCRTVSQKRDEICSWDVLRNQITTDLKKTGKTLPLSQINQLLILRNFATLRLKGYRIIPASLEIARQWHEKDSTHFARKVRSLAHHYQLFKQLPQERRGGAKLSRTLLLDETVQATARNWLVSQGTGRVTPRDFQRALNDKILPALNITLVNPLCERTARHWLIKLGWRKTQIRKGVYMDGHEREDVVKYRNEEFLPRMKAYETCMTHYVVDGTHLKPIEPTLQPGQKKIIALFQDESSFHANEYNSSAWFVPLVLFDDKV